MEPYSRIIEEYKAIEPWKGADQPAHLVAFQIKLKGEDDGVELQCKGIKEYSDITPGNIQARITAIAAQGFQFEKVQNYKPFKSSFSFMNDRQLTYIVFKWKNRKIRFSNGRFIFSIGTEYDDALFGDATKVAPNGALYGAGSSPDCRVAFFIMDGLAAYDRFRNQLADGFQFNMHIDVQSESQTQDGPAEASYIPLLLDPDIRWPGGNGP